MIFNLFFFFQLKQTQTEMNEYGSEGIIPAQHNDLPVPHEFSNNAAKHRAIIFMAFINVG